MKQEFAVDVIKNWPKDQVRKDLQYLLENNFSNPSYGIRIISEKTNISKKTLQRIIKEETKPNQQSVMRFYEYFFKIAQPESMSIQHSWIKDYFLKVLTCHYGKLNEVLEKKLESDVIFRKLYIRLSMYSLSKAHIEKLFGSYGLSILLEMEKMSLLESVDNKWFKLRDDVSIAKSPSALKEMVIELNQDFVTTENLSEVNKNSVFYFCENISDSAYQTILEASEELKKTIRKILLSSDSKGDIPFFLTTSIDRMDI
tara:strand:- start:2618 stop:3388 length:771 start_codon:yes stop_codon:yes gene_type:complete